MQPSTPSRRVPRPGLENEQAADPGALAVAEADTTPPHVLTVPRGRRRLQAVFSLGLLVLAIGVLYLIRDVAGAFILGAVLAFLVDPVVRRLQAVGVPRPIGILFTFAVAIGLLAGLVTLVAPLTREEVDGLSAQAPSLAALAQSQLSQLQGHPLNLFGYSIDLTSYTNSVEANANQYLLGQFGNALGIGIAAITTLLQVVLMLIVAFLFALDARRISELMRRMVPPEYRIDFDEIWSDVRQMLYSYMRGQLFIGALIGIASGLACWALGLKFPLALGLLAGLTALIPYLGPFLGAVPAVLIALAMSPQKAIAVGIAYLVISNVVLNLVYPKVVGDAVKLPPLLVIVAFLAGFSLAGILGMFIAVPVAATIRILYDHIQPRLYGAQA